MPVDSEQVSVVGLLARAHQDAVLAQQRSQLIVDGVAGADASAGAQGR